MKKQNYDSRIVRKFKKRPVVIEALQLRWDNWNEMCEFVDKNSFGGGIYIDKDKSKIGLKINTLEGQMIAIENDWIIKGINGEFYPCKPDIFEKTYEEIKDIKK